jgi:hypothetical protein
MHPQRERKTSPVFLLNSVDRLGREIEPAVLSVAQEIGTTAVRYAEKLLGDPAIAITLFGEAALIIRILAPKLFSISSLTFVDFFASL